MGDDLVERLRDSCYLAFDDNTNDYQSAFEAADRIEALEAQSNYFQQQYVRKCEHEIKVRQQNQKLEEALREINKRLNDSDSWLAQSIDCRNIAEAALGEKKDG